MHATLRSSLTRCRACTLSGWYRPRYINNFLYLITLPSPLLLPLPAPPAAILSALLACTPAGASTSASGSAELASSWQVPPDTFINAWRSRQGLGAPAGKSATTGAALPANSGVGLPPDTYINTWRSRQGEAPNGSSASAASQPSVPSNVAQARAWIHNWLSKQGRA